MHAFNLFIVFAILSFFAAATINAASQIDITRPKGTSYFGGSVVALPNGNVVVTAALDDTPAGINHAVYLYNGKTGALISTLTGKYIGGRITVLPNGNFVLQNYFWDDGTGIELGSVTWCSGATGCSGTVSAANSLVGAASYEHLGHNDIRVLPNGNYLVPSLGWNNSGAAGAGAVTFCDGNTGCAGVVSAANSLVGTSFNDNIGSIYILSNGSYVVTSKNWDNGAAVDAGAVTWCSGTKGCTGAVSAANSLVGTQTNDLVGNYGVVALPNGNYVVISRDWNNGSATRAGAVTWGSGSVGTSGEVSAANSLVGSHTDDFVGNSLITVLTNGNYVVMSKSWDNGAITDAGAATWGNGLGGTFGEISAANSLVGTHPDDSIGERVTALTNGNYVVNASVWNNDKIVDAGAATWGDGSTGVVGAVSTTNSLFGTKAGDGVGGSVYPLTNGNYVVESSDWDNGTIFNAGAVTWGDGFGGTVAAVSAANSLVGNQVEELVGQRVVALTNGNYVIATQKWNNNAASLAGAVTWGNGQGGTSGVVSAENSLVGTQQFDGVGGYVAPLANGNYVVLSSNWKNGSAARAGAITWGNGSVGTVGVVSVANSLVGTQIDDNVGDYGVTALSNGNYVVNSRQWKNGGTINNKGAVTWGNGQGGTVGAVSAVNSLIGTQESGNFGSYPVFELPNGNYLVRNASWDNGAAQDVGAVTWCSGTTGCSGAISAANSLTGSTGYDYLGKIIRILPNGNYVIRSEYWRNGSIPNAGALTYGAGNGGTVGAITADNSILGRTAGDGLGFQFSYDSFNETLVVGNPYSNIVSIFNPTYTSIADGSWSAGATWNYGAFTKLHDVYIPDGRTINLDVVDSVNSLRIDCTGAVSGANSSAYIIGSVRKDFCSTGAFSYPTGTANGFSPVDANITALAVKPSSLTAGATQSAHPALNQNYSLKRFWTLNETGDLTADLTFKYLDADVSAAEQTYKLYRVAGGVPAQVAPFSLNAGANTVSTTGVSDFSDWAVGNIEPIAFNVGGRVVTSSGGGISKAKIVITGVGGESYTAYTGSFGLYQFDNVPAGGPYTISVSAGRYHFAEAAQVITVKNSLDNVSFVAEP